MKILFTLLILFSLSCTSTDAPTKNVNTSPIEVHKQELSSIDSLIKNDNHIEGMKRLNSFREKVNDRVFL